MGQKLPFKYQSYHCKCIIEWSTENNGFACALMCGDILIGAVWLINQLINRYNRPELAINRGS
jgi:hypothetical protein